MKPTSLEAPPSRPAPRGGKPLFTRITDNRPADGIHSQIRALLASRRLVAGDRLPSERDLAEQFGVSRNSVRQALRSMVDSGLLDMKKGAAGGAFVRDDGGTAVRAVLTDLYTLGTIQPSHLTEVRMLIGVEVVRLACERATEEEFDALERNVESAAEAARVQDLPMRTAINLEFYRMLARMTRNPLLEILTDAVMAITQKFVEEFMRTGNTTVMPFRRKLLEDLRARDVEAAAERMRDHLLRLQKIYLTEVAQRRKREASAG
ncbi:MAG TPA: FCD domain-containing protein [Ramlibacter sp.]|nr:FCD domain-containing protein [Ramlibacter sp.]